MFLNITEMLFVPAIKVGFYKTGFYPKLYFHVIAVELDLIFV